MPESILQLTSGDRSAELLKKAGFPGDILAWRDVLYAGPRRPGWPDEESLAERAAYLAEMTGGGLSQKEILKELRRQYRQLKEASRTHQIVLWFDACLFDQSMLVHLLSGLHQTPGGQVELICVNAFPGIEPFHGLGQLTPAQIATLYTQRQPVTEEQFAFAEMADTAFAAGDPAALERIAGMTTAPLPHVPAAAARWLQEQPDPRTGLGKLETLTLEAVRAGKEQPGDIFRAVAEADTPPQFWGDTTLWAKINGLADREPALVRIEGPADRLPLWKSEHPLSEFKISPF